MTATDAEKIAAIETLCNLMEDICEATPHFPRTVMIDDLRNIINA